ncbi:NADH-quinone oxidoreductase subunit NuoG [Tahibacter amnicola]|uniref:NADH-quinone oxidoreductase n=1 Tax=Tahibacter amnicola TaxID=2976241 RepID=A0ABY6BK14_9GAMM|nr:NADH-quinone oxidoreductase subunit NuoG [Tahibacter amnicola]UXI69733.1 NADH-quinone oxidoreductase subunit NuoG [Tahibacter amnicola]
MSAQPVNPNTPPDHVNIEIDGKPMTAPKGSMIIHAADKAGVPIPRFCYHDKLPIAANCRMCLVEVEKSPKPMPACATPVMEGMKVLTRSAKALNSQRNVMEFLLINHPLDCPICDQGGECELQDVSMGYGRSVSRFVERKRAVADEDIGPLIATEMTRCIQCTRCVRFVGEVAGTYELGGMGRGENLEIGTYVGKTIESEIGGNIIDVCPVGALTNKPFRFRARAWELVAREGIGYHDAQGSNLWLHTRRGEVLRHVPRDNEAINECWLSDRDRYSHQGLYASDRALQPQVKRNGGWVAVSWDEALALVAEKLKTVSGDQLGTLVHPATSNEEGHLLAALSRGLDSRHIDHRLRQLDFVDGAAGNGFSTPVADIEKAGAVLLVGSWLRHELPLINHRVRKAAKRGAKVFALNPVDFDFNYDFAGKTIAAPAALVDEALKLAKAAAESGVAVPAELQPLLADIAVDDAARATVAALKDATASVLIVGEAAAMHPQASILRAAARLVAQATDSGYNEIPLGANAVGLSRVGVLPQAGGLDARSMLQQPRKAYLLYGAEAPFDFADGGLAMQALTSAETVVAFSAFASDNVKAVATIILPIAATPEIDATLVNLNGTAQVAAAGAKPAGESRPGWRVLRALGAKLGVSGFDFTEIADVRAAMNARPAAALVTNGKVANRVKPTGLARIATVPVYRGDAVLRRSVPLQSHPLTVGGRLVLHPADAKQAGLEQGMVAKVSGPVGIATLPVTISQDVPAGGAWIESAYLETAALPAYGADLSISKA